MKIEIVEVPFEGGSLPGYFVHAQNAKPARTPCVVFFDGLDVTKEIQFVRGVPDLIKRGISVLVMDGPGTGEAIRFRGLHLRHDYEVAGSACIDFLEKRADVDAKRIGIVAISLGGYYAPRCASLEPRFAACIAWGAIWDYHATWKRRIEAQFKASLSVPGPSHHVDPRRRHARRGAARGSSRSGSTASCRRCAARSCSCTARTTSRSRSPTRRRCTTPAARRTRRFRVFTAEEGGAQHCQRDYLTLGCAEMWNWFEDKLVRA